MKSERNPIVYTMNENDNLFADQNATKSMILGRYSMNAMEVE